VAHEFGGDWTDLKLEVMAAYFRAYATALKNQNFECWYVDAFAGTGERIDRRDSLTGDSGSLFGEEAAAIASAKDGSVQIALKIDPPFSRYFFIDLSKDHIEHLNSLHADHPERLIEVISGDANEELARICVETNWKQTRAAVFIDPYGMQVSWGDIGTISRDPSGGYRAPVPHRVADPVADAGRRYSRRLGAED
jgi:three-Cys-motif partner protein